jgi:hypothetical protein
MGARQDRQDECARLGPQFGVDGREWFVAAEAVWSSVNPQRFDWSHARDAALVALRAAKRYRGEQRGFIAGDVALYENEEGDLVEVKIERFGPVPGSAELWRGDEPYRWVDVSKLWKVNA